MHKDKIKVNLKMYIKYFNKVIIQKCIAVHSGLNKNDPITHIFECLAIRGWNSLK